MTFIHNYLRQWDDIKTYDEVIVIMSDMWKWYHFLIYFQLLLHGRRNIKRTNENP